jgi:peptidylprolyl isomerase
MRSALTVGALAALVLLPPAASSAAPKSPPPAAAPAAPAAPGPSDWRVPDPNDVLVIDTNKGRIFVELVPEVAPQFTARVRELAREHFYDGLQFFRVIDDFMAQTGDPKNDGTGNSTKPDVPPEFTFRRGEQTPFVLAQDETVAEVGFVKSMPVMSQTMSLAPLMADGMVPAWPLYCPGVAGAARSDDPNSANSQFFLMRAPYATLERKYTAFGRVIAGQDVVKAIKTGEPVAEPRDRMERVRVLADLPAAERPQVRVIDPRGPWFKAEMARVGPSSGPKYAACDVKIPSEVK